MDARVVPLSAAVEAPERADDELMLIARGGGQAAFDALVRRHQGWVLRLCARGVGDPSLAKDVAQATFVELHRSLPRYEPRGAFRSFLARIAVNQCRMAGRTRGRARRRDDAAEPPPSSSSSLPDDVVLARERKRQLDRALATLSPKLRDVVVLRYAADLSHAEIASALGVPIGTVKSRLFDAVEKLRDALAGEEP